MSGDVSTRVGEKMANTFAFRTRIVSLLLSQQDSFLSQGPMYIYILICFSDFCLGIVTQEKSFPTSYVASMGYEVTNVTVYSEPEEIRLFFFKRDSQMIHFGTIDK